jgi:tRNA pseudouridine32 synthase/23S rRNA pseudouridine746 synthase
MIFQKFDQIEVENLTLPEKFTFPFYYTPHALAKLASEKLQKYLNQQNDFEHNFGFDKSHKGLIIGKMFGVLVVQNQLNQLGYLWAFSGKLGNENHHKYFVPPIFDMLKTDGFFKKDEEVINQINANLEELECSQKYKTEQQNFENIKTEATIDIEKHKKLIKTNKALREQDRLIMKDWSFDKRNVKENALGEASKIEQILLKKMTKYWRYKIEEAQQKLDVFLKEINALKNQRKEKSAILQQKLFDAYQFLNYNGQYKSIGDIYNNNPPAGAGECAAPKLLHYAYQNSLKPICMAEFWWGQSPKSEVRIHQNYYPACKSKCEPLLISHMLVGLEVDENPFNKATELPKNIKIIYEDDHMLVIHKPEECLSVPGKIDAPSIYDFVKAKYPEASGPLIVHRLDMSTSGIMLIAKTEEAYYQLQQQFIKRTVKKTYIALLDGVITEKTGVIDLPLRVDLDDRPRQLICFEHGKPALTHWEVLKVKNNQTKIAFYPHSGRTHQLRVHAAHHLGLNTPIVGDDLYGKKANRLHLHAKSITFEHPKSKQNMNFEIPEEF